MKIRCLIVDDEPLAHTVIEQYSSSIPTIEIEKKCNNAFEAIAYLHENTVDVIFLDINMPNLSGFDFLKTLSYKPQIIITTAYAEYALKGYEFSVIDYLLKPFTQERFLQAINKIRISETKKKEQNESNSDSVKSIFLKSDKVNHKVYFSDILYVEGSGNFVKIITKVKKILVSETMNSFEQKLPKKDFLRIHRSYIIALEKIDKIDGNRIYIQDNKIPIGQTYKKDLETRIK